jgi:hypothetical protein
MIKAIIFLSILLISGNKKEFIEVHGVLINNVYYDNVNIGMTQIVFMDIHGKSLGYCYINSDKDSVRIYELNKKIFLSNGKAVSYKIKFPDKNTDYDYEQKIRDVNVKRILP